MKIDEIPENFKKIDEVIENNPLLGEDVEPTTPIKEWLVNYVGNEIQPDDGNITVEMIVAVMAQEFPEFLMALAEENWIRGYHQGVLDNQKLTSSASADEETDE